MSLRPLIVIAFMILSTALARAQNPIQWQGNALAAIAHATEQSMPLLFWITEREDLLNDDGLRDAQEEAFRDPAVVALAQKRFIPVQLGRNSRMLEEAEKLGLPTTHGLYIAVVSPEGKLVQQINPGEVADAETLANLLLVGLHRYLDDLYAERLRPVIVSPESPKNEVRRALQTVWRLGIVKADKDCAALLERADLTPSERARLATMLGGIATAPCIEALLTRAAAGDKDAASALERADAGALETLLKELPVADGPAPGPRQLEAYRAACRIAREPGPRAAAFWAGATPAQRAQAIDSLRRRAEPVLEYWNENVGRWR